MIKARLFDKQSSGFDDVSLEFKDNELIIHTPTQNYTYAIDELKISERLGNMPRSIYLSDERVCECEDNDSIDKELKSRKLSSGSRLIHHLESKSIYILPALVVTIAIIFIFLKYIVPYSAQKIAYSIPQNIASEIGTGTLQALDKVALDPSKLSSQKKDEIQKEFKKMASKLKDLPPLKLEFRFSSKVGPNSFALPDGTIVMTDQLVVLSHNNEELLSILAHEIGHIKNRHAIRMLLQNSAVFVVIATVTGDATTASSILSALPTMLIESSFSRELEEEADDYAMEVMKSSGIALHYFADIMIRLSEGHEESENEEYFSSHPITSSRIAKFQE